MQELMLNHVSKRGPYLALISGATGAPHYFIQSMAGSRSRRSLHIFNPSGTKTNKLGDNLVAPGLLM